MEWLLLAALGIIWAAFLLPSGGRRSSPNISIEEFEKNMDLLADTEGEGRWVVTPRKGAQFIGARARQRTRILERRRKVLTFLVEATGLTFLIGLFGPLRPVWILTSGLAVVLFGYCWMLVRLRTIESGGHGVAQHLATEHRAQAVPERGRRYVASRNGGVARTSYAGLSAYSDENVHVVLRARD